MPHVADTFVRVLRQDLDIHSDPREARRLTRLHKGDIPFRGTPWPQVVRLVHTHLHPVSGLLDDRRRWEAVVRGLWSGDDLTRESRYAALAVIRAQRFRAFASAPASTSLYRDLIVDAPSTDTVDAVAALCLPLILDASPDTEAPVVRNWALVESVWLRRAAILSQVRRGVRTDPDLWKVVIVPNLRERRQVLSEAIAISLEAFVTAVPTAAAPIRACVEGYGDPIPAPLNQAVGRILDRALTRA